MNSLGKYVLTKTQKIVLLVVVFALIAGPPPNIIT